MKSNPPLPALVRIAIGILLGAAAMLETGCGLGRQPAPLTEQDQSVLAAYEQIRVALAADDFVATKARAHSLADLVKPPGSNAHAAAIESQTQTMIDAVALDRQREAFGALSLELAPLAKGRPGYYILSSPTDPQEIWIQRSPAADNPYMGKVMHDSGVVMH